MKRIIYKKTEIIENEKVFELEISDAYYKKLSSGKLSVIDIVGLYGAGDLLDKKSKIKVEEDFHSWEDFPFEKKSVKSWYELLPLMFKVKRFEVLFIKKDLSERKMKCEFEATNHIDKGVLTVWDLDFQDYRSVNLETLKKVVIQDTIFTLEEGELLYV